MSNSYYCLYNVYTRDGLRRMNGFQVTREYGRDIWDLYTEAVDHSEWCNRRACVEARRAAVPAGIWSDPFLSTDPGNPPF